MYTSNPVKIGRLLLGGGNPVRIQSMTNTPTRNIEETTEQCIRIFDAGGDMARITTPTLKEVKSLEKIKSLLVQKGYNQPLIADVHFKPVIAIETAKIVEKVRINPGNYIPGKYTGPDHFDEKIQKQEMEKIHERILPLITTCKENNTAIRIGVNHGSMAERIRNWYGDSPEGMANSAMEFMQLFHQEHFEDLVISLKSSSVKAMVSATRLLAARMDEAGFHYPFHLGVTEAGNEEEGRIKSALGIGTLLAEGIGDTIRVSLTEAPENEIPVAIKIVETARPLSGKQNTLPPEIESPKRETVSILTAGGKNPIAVITSIPHPIDKEKAKTTGGFSEEAGQGIKKTEQSADLLIQKNEKEGIPYFELIEGKNIKKNPFPVPLISLTGKKGINSVSENIPLLFIHPEEYAKYADQIEKHPEKSLWIMDLSSKKSLPAAREVFRDLAKRGTKAPVILYKKLSSENPEEMMIRATHEPGALLLDGCGEGIWLEEENPEIPAAMVRETAFNILQASGTRITKTEYIACPSCGRTLFDIQSVLKKVKEATTGFKGLKIAVMGCIVNGPGEMADADFGYVGAGPGRVSIYKGKIPVKKNIPENIAVQELINVIKENTPENP